MLTSINLDGDLGVVAGEVDNETVDRNLSPKVEAVLAQLSEAKLKSHLLLDHCHAEFAGDLIGHAHNVCRSPHPVASPDQAWVGDHPPRQGEG